MGEAKPMREDGLEAEDYAMGAIEALGGGASPSPRDGLRQELLDLLDAPRAPIDPLAHAWTDLAPGIRMVQLRADPARNMRGCLVWAQPGAKTPAHRHLGDEVILVLQGVLRDEYGSYSAGQICRSREGSTHTEEVLPGEECFCYVVYYGDHEIL